jgi:hypothetical protein
MTALSKVAEARRTVKEWMSLNELLCFRRKMGAAVRQGIGRLGVSRGGR